MRVDKAGGAPETIADTQGSPICVRLDATSVYWATTTNASGVVGLGAIWKAPK